MKTKIGIIGGSGLDKPNLLAGAHDRDVSTVWGTPSSPLREGIIDGVPILLLARHRREHTLPPAQVNYRANIQALKDAGCTHILATTAVGSLRKKIARGDLVIVDQFIDWTRQRKNTYYEQFSPHSPVHTPMASPYDSFLRQCLIAGCRQLGYSFHPRGTVITIEGPRFSTRAESRMFRKWGADIINMSVATETILANEAGIPYAAVAMTTDYDCWRKKEEPVSWEAILSVFRRNAKKVTRLLQTAVSLIASSR